MAQLRNSRPPRRDDNNRMRIKIGTRKDYRIFRFSSSVSPKDFEFRCARLKEVYTICGGWNDLSDFIATQVEKGVSPVPLPPKELARFLNVEFDGWVNWRAVLTSQFPLISWTTLGASSVNKHVLGAIRHLKTKELNEAAAVVADIDNRPPATARPIPGTLHEALDAYAVYTSVEEWASQQPILKGTKRCLA